MDVSISLNLLVFFLFPRTPLRYKGTFNTNPVAIGWLLRIMGAIEEYGAVSYCVPRAQFLLQPTPSIKYCTYTLIISSDFSEALNSE